MNLRTLLFGSTLRVAATAAGVLTASVVGAFALGVIGVPGVAAVDNSFGEVTNETTVVNTDLVVTNPNPVGVRLGDTTVDYTVYMNDVAVATGNKSGIAVGTGNSTLAFSTRMDNGKIPAWWASHIDNGEQTVVTVDATVESGLLGGREFALEQKKQVNTSIIAQFNSEETRPVSGPPTPVYSNPVLYINETDAEWGDVSERRTPIEMAFVVYNPQLKPYTLTEVGYEIRMNGIPVGAGTTDQPYVVEGKTTETVRTTPTIDNRKLPRWWVSHLRANQTTRLRIDFHARVELPTGQTVRLPLDALTYERTIETDIFGESDAAGSETPTAGSEAATATSTPTPTDAGAGSTPTPDDTPTPTETDDGGLV